MDPSAGPNAPGWKVWSHVIGDGPPYVREPVPRGAPPVPAGPGLTPGARALS